MITPGRFGLYDPQTEHDACGVGFVVHIKGEKSRQIVEDALSILVRLRHRAATGSDPLTGDGAGILLQLPHGFFQREMELRGWEVLPPRRYGVAMVFLPTDPKARAACERALEDAVYIAVHYRANTRAGNKKIIGYVHFACRLLLCYRIAILVYKAKRLYIADYRQFCFPVIGTLKQKIVKACKHQQKCPTVKKPFFSLLHK